MKKVNLDPLSARKLEIACCFAEQSQKSFVANLINKAYDELPKEVKKTFRLGTK